MSPAPGLRMNIKGTSEQNRESSGLRAPSVLRALSVSFSPRSSDCWLQQRSKLIMFRYSNPATKTTVGMWRGRHQ
mgnify:FL=1